MKKDCHPFDKEMFEILKQEYKERLKINLTLGCFEKLREFINQETLEEEQCRIDNKETGYKSEDKVSSDSIKRHFGLIGSKSNPSLSSCSFYAQRLGYINWDDFCEKKQRQYEASKGFMTIDFHQLVSLEKGQTITIGWYPKKYCRLESLGNFGFKVVESYGMKSKCGRIFETSGFRLFPGNNNKAVLPEVIIEPLHEYQEEEWEALENFNPEFFPAEMLL